MDAKIRKYRDALDDRVLAIVRAKVGDDAVALMWRTDPKTGADVPVFPALKPETQDKLKALGLEIA